MLARAGVTQVGLNTHHLAQRMAQVATAEAARFGLGLTLSHESVIQGTAGGIRGLRQLVEQEDTFVVWNGDALFTPDLGPLLAEHRALRATATLVLLPMPAGAPYASVETDAAGRVRRIAGRGPGGNSLRPWHFTGVHLLSPRIFSAMAESGPEDINRDVYPRLLAQGELVRGAVVQAAWRDVGTAEGYLQAQHGATDGGRTGRVWRRLALRPGWQRASPVRGSRGAGPGHAASARLPGHCSPSWTAAREVGPNVYLGPMSASRPDATCRMPPFWRALPPLGRSRTCCCGQEGSCRRAGRDLPREGAVPRMPGAGGGQSVATGRALAGASPFGLQPAAVPKQDAGDVVVAAGLVGEVNQLLARGLEVVGGLHGRQQRLVVHHARQPV